MESHLTLRACRRSVSALSVAALTLTLGACGDPEPAQDPGSEPQKDEAADKAQATDPAGDPIVPPDAPKTTRQADPPLTPEQRMAKRFAERSNQLWSQSPEPGTANLRFLFRKDGKPYRGKLSIRTDFSFSAQGRGTTHTQAAMPNTKGRWVYEGLEPGTYTLLRITGTPGSEFEGWAWEKHNTSLSDGESPLFNINLDGR